MSQLEATTFSFPTRQLGSVLFCSVTRADCGQGSLPVPRSHLWCRWLGVLHWGGKALGATNTLWDNWNQGRKVFSDSSSPESWDVAPTPKPHTGWLLYPNPLITSHLQIYLFCQFLLSVSLFLCLLVLGWLKM